MECEDGRGKIEIEIEIVGLTFHNNNNNNNKITIIVGNGFRGFLWGKEEGEKRNKQ